jgi:formamidopyrimidine-DNA glycosylase
MPELPEVETMRRGILPIVGATIVAAERTPCPKRPISIKPRIDRLSKRLAGKKIKAIERLGKRVVIRTRDDQRLLLEPRMTGLVLIDEPPTAKHLRFRLKLKGRKTKELLFWDQRGLGCVYLLSDQEYQDKVNDGSIGPDAIEISAEELRERMSKSRREIKVALLDQSMVAGVGNLYASELLFVAGIDPRLRCNRVTQAQWVRIHQAMVDILLEAIKSEGSTLSDGTYRNAVNDPGSYQNHHQVYDRAGANCPKCGDSKIIRIVQAQRSTFFCKRCQRKRDLARTAK